MIAPSSSARCLHGRQAQKQSRRTGASALCREGNAGTSCGTGHGCAYHLAGSARGRGVTDGGRRGDRNSQRGRHRAAWACELAWARCRSAREAIDPICREGITLGRIFTTDRIQRLRIIETPVANRPRERIVRALKEGYIQLLLQLKKSLLLHVLPMMRRSWPSGIIQPPARSGRANSSGSPYRRGGCARLAARRRWLRG